MMGAVAKLAIVDNWELTCQRTLPLTVSLSNVTSLNYFKVMRNRTEISATARNLDNQTPLARFI